MRMALVIDDELDICLMVTKHLQNLQFKTNYALTVKDARQKVSLAECELMFIDLNLPDGSGFDVIHYVNELKLNSKIIVISAYDSESNKALRMGASHFMTKPFTTKKINDALKALNFLPN